MTSTWRTFASTRDEAADRYARWFILDDPRPSAAARVAMVDLQNEVLISPASYWEIAIKVSNGKLVIGQPFDPFIEQQIAVNRFGVLPIEPRHVARLIDLPNHHRDPFDRLLVAQSLAEKIPLVSGDSTLDRYGMDRLW